MPRVRLPNGELRDEIRQVLWDNSDLANAVSPVGTVSFFSNVQNKAKDATNLRQNNLLEAAVSFRCMGLSLDAQNIYSADIAVLPLIMENSYLEFKVGEKIYWQGNGTFAGGRVELSAAAATTVAATTINNVHQKLGASAVQAVGFTGPHVIDIPPLQSFRVDWIVNTKSAAETAAMTRAAGAGTFIRFLLSLKGLLRRPVQ